MCNGCGGCKNGSNAKLKYVVEISDDSGKAIHTATFGTDKEAIDFANDPELPGKYPNGAMLQLYVEEDVAPESGLC